ncbi:RsiV family protein [Sporosarcina aquimarina]|uniref:RsiV family protein n=1 Tax=Sporosarcina aquimarina TaxID=114975 RepID=A0ABU4G2P0_9BACL|nr:RsiV family protein [Sporosarcina aquimarina]MDW0110605.1 RsiV family protein [Sporosarcina aquimarina]
MKQLKNLKKEYEDIDIPAELDEMVRQSIQKAASTKKKRSFVKRYVLSSAAAAALFVGSINASPAFANSLVNIPVLGSIVEVFTVQTLTLDEETYQANLETPAIDGLENEGLQSALNGKYIEENEKLFKQFKEDIGDMEEAGSGHLGIDTGYEVKTDTDQLLSIARYEVTTAGSSSADMQYDTIDKQNNILITLPSLFKDESYIAVINSYIKDEMERQMARDGNTAYFSTEEEGLEFSSIQADQNFYITEDHKLVISFDKYEIAPGYMGVVTFEIPSDILSDALVGDAYIR